MFLFLIVVKSKIHLRGNFSIEQYFKFAIIMKYFVKSFTILNHFLVPALILKIQKIPKNSPKEGLIGRGQRILVQG